MGAVISLIAMAFWLLIIFALYTVLMKIIDRCSIGKSVVQPQPQLTQQQLYLLHQKDYIDYCDALIDCVANNYTTLDLCRPGNRPQHMAPGYSGVRLDNLYGVVYCYHFDRSRGPTSGGIGKAVYSTFPASQMMQKLNGTFSNYCVALGLQPHNIVSAVDVGNGKVEFTICLMEGVKLPFLSSSDVSAIALLWLVLSNLGREVADLDLTAPGYIKRSGSHTVYSIAVLLRDDQEFPEATFCDLLDEYSKISPVVKPHFYGAKSYPASIRNFSRVYVSVYL